VACQGGTDEAVGDGTMGKWEKTRVQKVSLDVSTACLWDLSAVGAIDKILDEFRRDRFGGGGGSVSTMPRSTIVEKLAIHDQPSALDQPTRGP
jgi:sulfate permease, SulP family